MSDTNVGAVKLTAEMESGGVKTGVQEVVKELGKLEKAATKAGESGKQIGNGAAEGANKLDAATKRSIQSIERQTLSIGKSRSEYLSAKAAIDGNTAALAPYIQKLKEAEAAQAAQATAQAFAAKAALAAAATGAALAGMVKHAIDAADAMNDMSQRTGIAVKDLAAYKLAADQSGTSLEGVGKGMKKLATAIIDNGDALQKAGITATDTSGAMRQLADLFSQLPDGAQKSALATRLFGKAGEELIPLLNLGSKGLDESAKASKRYAEAMQILAPEADKFNDSMAELSINLQAAGVDIANSFLPQLNKAIESFKLAREAGIGFFQSLTGFGLRDLGDSLAESTAKAGERIKSLGNELDRLKQGLANPDQTDASRDVLKSKIADAEKLLAYYKKIQIAAIETGPQHYDARDRSLKDAGILAAAQAAAELDKNLKGAGESAKKAKDEFGELLNRLNAKDVGLDASFGKDLQTLFDGYKAGKLTLDEYRDVVTKLVTQQKFHQDALKETAKWQEEARKAEASRLDTMMKATDTLAEQVKRAREENDEIGLTTEQLDALKLARMDATIAAKEQELATASLTSTSAAEIELLRDQVEALRELRDITSSSQIKTANKKALDDQAKAWENFSRDIEQSLTDALMRSFEAGDNFGEAFAKNLKNTFKTMILKLAVQAVVSPVMSGVQSMLGIPQTGSSAGGSILNMASSANSLYGLASGGGVFGGFSAGAASAASELAMGASFVGPSATLAGGSVGAGASAAMATGSSAAASGMATAASAMPYVAAAFAVASALGVFSDKEAAPEMWFNSTSGVKDTNTWWNKVKGIGAGVDTPFGSMSVMTQHMGDEEGLNKQLRAKYLDPLVTLDKAIASLLKDSEVDAVRANLKKKTILADTGGEEGGIQALLQQRLDQITDAIGGWTNDAADALSGNLQEVYAKTIQLLMLRNEKTYNKLAASLVDSSDEFAKSGEKMGDTIIRLVGSLDTVNDAFDAMGNTLLSISGTGASAASDLIDAFGGADQFKAATSAYYDAFYTDAEKLANTTRLVGKAFDDLDLVMPESLGGFRAIVDGLDLTSEAGRELYVSLMGIAPAFAEIGQAAVAAAQTAYNTASSNVSNAESTLRDAYNREADAKQAVIDGLKDQIDSLREMQRTLAGFRRELLVSDLSPKSAVDRYGMAKDSFRDTVAAAQAGDLNAAAQLPALGQQMLALSKEVSTTSVAYAMDFAEVSASLEGTEIAMGVQADLAGIQVKVQEDSLKALQDQVGQFIQLNATALSVVDAIAQLQTAISSRDTAYADLQKAKNDQLALTEKDKAAIDAANIKSAQIAYVEALETGREQIAKALGISEDKVNSTIVDDSVAKIAAALKNTNSSSKDVVTMTEKQLEAAISNKLKIEPESIDMMAKGDLIKLAIAVGAKRSDASYAVGTAYVPKDMTADIHKGEIVVDPQSAGILRRYGIGLDVGSNPELIAEIRALREDLRAGNSAVAGHTSKTARLLERVIPDGDAFAVRTAA